MIEWNRANPKHNTKRIKRIFCFFPIHCEQNKVVWLDFIYKFQTFYVPSTENFESYWHTEAILSPSQFKKYIDNISLYLVDNNYEVREYAHIAKQYIK